MAPVTFSAIYCSTHKHLCHFCQQLQANFNSRFLILKVGEGEEKRGGVRQKGEKPSKSHYWVKFSTIPMHLPLRKC
jgi:hypothetical protein